MFCGLQLNSECGAMSHRKQIYARIATVPVALEDEFESVQIIAPKKASRKYLGFSESNASCAGNLQINGISS
jgi:hypothetical protein